MRKVTKPKLYRKLDVFIHRRLGPTRLRSEDGLLYWRERIFHFFSIGVLLIGLIVYLFLGLTFIQHGEFVYAVLASFIFFSAIFAAAVRSLPFKFRISWLLFLLYLIGIYTLLKTKESSLGYIFFISYSLLSGILVGQRRAWMSVLTITVTLIAVAIVLYHPEIQQLPFEPKIPLDEYIRSSVAFLVIVLVTLLPLISLLNGLVFNLEKETRFRVLLRREHEDLILAKRKAEESDHLKTAFLSNMSHEIRTPMNAILGFSNLLSHPDISGIEKEEFINLIRINGKNLLTLVEDIIDISKIDSGQLQIKNAPCNLHQLMIRVNDSFAEDIKRRGLFNLKLYLKEGITDKNIRILTDEHRLQQILINLVGNAVKFTERGFVEFGYTQEDDQLLQFYIKDTGIGLPEDKENEIFERFSKFNNDKDRLYGGTGIGLSIVKHLVDLMGGDIWVESEPHIGTTFYFTIPYHRLTIPVNDSEEIPKATKEFNWEGKTFLVAEDEEDNFRYIEIALALSNASLIWARDGQEAVDVFKRISDIDLVLMDIKMPLMDGYTATREIKSLSKQVPVIAQTAYAMSEEKEKSMQAGCDDYIAKPIGYDDLLTTINRFVPSNGV